MYKKRIIMLFISLVIYFSLICVQNHVAKNNVKVVYILNKDVSKGEKIDRNVFKEIKVDSTTFDIQAVENVENLVAKFDLKEGQIITDKMTEKMDKSNMLDNEDKEIVFINISEEKSQNESDFGSDSIINIYYTGRSSQLSTVLNGINAPKIESSSISDAYTTVLLLREVKVKGVFNSDGKMLEETKDEKINFISVEVDSDMALLIENLKNYGSFNVTIKR